MLREAARCFKDVAVEEMAIAAVCRVLNIALAVSCVNPQVAASQMNWQLFNPPGESSAAQGRGAAGAAAAEGAFSPTSDHARAIAHALEQRTRPLHVHHDGFSHWRAVVPLDNDAPLISAALDVLLREKMVFLASRIVGFTHHRRVQMVLKDGLENGGRIAQTLSPCFSRAWTDRLGGTDGAAVAAFVAAASASDDHDASSGTHTNSEGNVIACGSVAPDAALSDIGSAADDGTAADTSSDGADDRGATSPPRVSNEVSSWRRFCTTRVSGRPLSTHFL